MLLYALVLFVCTFQERDTYNTEGSKNRHKIRTPMARLPQASGLLHCLHKLEHDQELLPCRLDSAPDS